MMKLFRGLAIAAAITVLTSQSSQAFWGSWSWFSPKPTYPQPSQPLTPPPTSPPTGYPTGGYTGGGGGGTPAVPEPGTMLLMGTGAAAFAFARRRRNQKTAE